MFLSSQPSSTKGMGFLPLVLRWAFMLFQRPMLFENLAVYFSREVCESVPCPGSFSRDITQECFEDMALMDKAVFPAFWNFSQF